MEFWGVEVKPGEPLQIKPEVSKLIHISQAAVGEVKNGKGPKKVHLRLKIDDKMYAIGNLSAEDRPQILFDLVLHKEFELSHDWKDGSIYLAGYIGDDESYGEGLSDEDEDEDNQVDTLQNGNLEPVKPATGKTALVKSKPFEKPISKGAKQKRDKATSDEDGDDSDVSEDSDDDESELEVDSDALEHLMYGDDSDDEDDNDESDDDIDQDLVSHKKRPSETAIESLLPAAKKIKLAASEKSGGKNPATNGKLKEHNPKSDGQMSSKSISKTLNTSTALHPKAKAKRSRK